MMRSTVVYVMVLACLAGRAHADSAGPGLVKTLVPYHPFDGHSSYALEKDEDEPIRRSQNLMTAKNRLGMKPYGKLFKDGSFQQERLIFNDVATGAEIHLLTRDYGDDVPYHLGAWSANGAHIVWRRPIFGWSPVQSDGPMAMNSDGSNIRPVFRDKGNVIKNIRCSPVDPKLCYAIVSPMKMIEFNILTGKAERDMGEVPGAWHLKISMDGKYLYANTWDYRAPKGRENSIIWVRSVDGRENKHKNCLQKNDP